MMMLLFLLYLKHWLMYHGKFIADLMKPNIPYVIMTLYNDKVLYESTYCICFSLALLSWSYIKQKPSLECSEAGSIYSFHISIFIFTSLNLMMLFGMIHYSLCGTLINERPRLNVSRILHSKLVLDIAGLIMAIQRTHYTITEVCLLKLRQFNMLNFSLAQLYFACIFQN